LFTSEKHHARTLHYDLRLEKDGVFKSWAVPKMGLAPITTIGACPIFGDSARRLAIQVDDHDLEFGDFEGEIPAGEYGADQVEIWDRGTYESASWSDDVVRQAF
jgi:bifunctional non-homologous end joining protein LigD